MAPQHSSLEESKQQSLVFDLKHQIKAYATHHNNNVNIGIHLTCIPQILWTFIVVASRTGPLFQAPASSKVLARLFQILPPNAGILFMASYCLYYIKLDKVAGLLTMPIFMALAKSATEFGNTRADAVKIAALIHMVAWSAQFIGHGFFEKRAPKLLDNPLQALVLAPYFVVYEVLFFLGYRPQLKADINKAVEANIREWKAEKAQKAQKRQ